MAFYDSESSSDGEFAEALLDLDPDARVPHINNITDAGSHAMDLINKTPTAAYAAAYLKSTGVDKKIARAEADGGVELFIPVNAAFAAMGDVHEKMKDPKAVRFARSVMQAHVSPLDYPVHASGDGAESREMLREGVAFSKHMHSSKDTEHVKLKSAEGRVASARIISSHHVGPVVLNEDGETYQRAAQVHFVDTVLVGGNRSSASSAASLNNNNSSGSRTKAARN